MAERQIYYAGYGANSDSGMIEAITGRPPIELGGVTIQDVELCVQRVDQTPDTVVPGAPVDISIRDLLMQDENWGKHSNFETYGIRKKLGQTVAATLFQISPLERSLIAEWEMIDYGWYTAIDVKVIDGLGRQIEAVTEGFTPTTPVDRVVSGGRYALYLNDRDRMHAIAERRRIDLLKHN